MSLSDERNETLKDLLDMVKDSNHARDWGIVFTETFSIIEQQDREFIKKLKEFLESAAEHGEGCRCPMRMNKYAKNAILNKIDYLSGDAYVATGERGKNDK